MHKIEPSGRVWQERRSASHLIESVWTSSTQITTSRTVIADPCTSISLVQHNGTAQIILMGPKTKPYRTPLAAGCTYTTIRLKPGVFLKSFPAQKLINNSCILPADSRARFWLEGMRLQFPDFDHVELLVDQLYDRGQLGYTALNRGHVQVAGRLSPRTYSRQIKRITGLSPYQLYQLQRMHQALRLLKQGVPAADVASELAFVDQPHLIRASRQFLGHTPKQLSNIPQTP